MKVHTIKELADLSKEEKLIVKSNLEDRNKLLFQEKEAIDKELIDNINFIKLIEKTF